MPDGGTITVEINTLNGISTIDEAMIPIKGLTRENPDCLSICVTDQGCGISDDQMDKILDPFISFRDDGIGLGLSIVDQILKSHKGRLNIKSTPGQGTQIQVLLPIVLQEN